MKKVVLLFVILTVFVSGSYAENLNIEEINGTEFTLLSNTGQCLSNCEAWIKWDLTQGILSNVQIPLEPTSEFNFKLTKETQNTNDLENFGIEVWEEIKGKWEKVADSIYGFEAIQGKVYRLRVWGNRQATLGSNNIDWIPTFFGEEISKWAWWNSSWKNRIVITLNTSSTISGNITQDLVIPIDINSEQTGFWSFVKSSGNGVRFLASDNATELNFYLEKFDKTNQEMVAWVQITDTFEAAANQKIYVYFNNAAAESGQKFRRDVYPDLYMAGWDFNETTGTTAKDVIDSDTNNLSHTNTPALNSTGVLNGGIKYDGVNQYSSTATLLDRTYGELSYSAWFSIEEGYTSAEGTDQYIIRKSNAGSNSSQLRFDNATGSLRWFIEDGSGHNLFSSKVVWAADTYFHAIATFSDSANVMNLYINGSITDGGTLSEPLGKVSAGGIGDFFVSFTTDFFDGNMDAIRVYNRVLTADEAKLIYAGESSGLQEFGIIEGGLTDLNITTINGLSFLTNPMFAHGLDGDITIDFNVFQKDNNRLSIDLNYSSTTAQGTGTVIIKDLNLTETYCPVQNWNVVPSECSFSWDYSSVEDANYRILGLLRIDTVSFQDFNASDGNLQIANDVNLLIQIPINEETGNVIDISVTSFIVRINAGGILSVFNLVEIDTNTPVLFNSRVYAFSFPTAQVSETLQPYLPPVAASILTTVKTLEFENLKPIPNVQLRVFKDLATGRTLIHDSVTDGKGETTIPFIVADLYEIDVLVDGVIIFTEFYIATATTNEHFIFISSTGAVVPPSPLTTPTVVFTPAQKHFNTIDINLGVVVSTELSNIVSIHFFITNNDFNIFDGGVDTGDISDGNTYSININNLQDVSDNNFPFFSTVIVVLDDGNSFVFYASYSIKPGANEVLNILMYDMRTEFECDTSDLSVRCDGLMFIAFFITLFVLCAFAAGARGILGGEGLTLIGLILLGFFTFIAWIPLWILIVMIFAAMGVILTRTRFIGA